MLNDEEKSKNSHRYYIIIIIIIIIIAIVVLCAAFYCIMRSGGDNGSGNNDIRNQLNEAGNAQQSITTGIENAENTADGIAGSIGESETAIGNAGTTVTRLEEQQRQSGEIIAECQRILEGIRTRNETRKE
ncbi:hypothetical protein [uncultured Phascolarctobacterium sp.]|uniref:hypothetical protein n=1 Tax=uncultured Phascolarctobacterium sp. TaxID=512296 RepID=UPI0027D93AC2|nr:hypothetical protein [uncultured Phascolarctobacterium sp.]